MNKYRRMEADWWSFNFQMQDTCAKVIGVDSVIPDNSPPHNLYNLPDNLDIPDNRLYNLPHLDIPYNLPHHDIP